MGCPIDDAEDVVQSALVRCHRFWSRVQRADEPDAYVYRVLVNVFRSARARRWNDEVPTEEIPDAVREDDSLTGIEVRRALSSLPAQHREVLVLRYFADL